MAVAVDLAAVWEVPRLEEFQSGQAAGLHSLWREAARQHGELELRHREVSNQWARYLNPPLMPLSTWLVGERLNF